MEHETFVRRWFEEVWNNKSEKAIDEMCAEDVIANGITDAEGNTIRGIEKYKEFVRVFLSAYPDLKIRSATATKSPSDAELRELIRATVWESRQPISRLILRELRS